MKEKERRQPPPNDAVSITPMTNKNGRWRRRRRHRMNWSLCSLRIWFTGACSFEFPIGFASQLATSPLYDQNTSSRIGSSSFHEWLGRQYGKSANSDRYRIFKDDLIMRDMCLWIGQICVCKACIHLPNLTGLQTLAQSCTKPSDA